VSVNMYVICHNVNVSVVCCVCAVDVRETIDVLVHYSTPAGQPVILYYIRISRNLEIEIPMILLPRFTLSLFYVASLIKVCFQKKRTSK
jgi:hypothetical protein